MGKLEGKHAFVTGCAAGIGRAISERLANEGATMLLADRDEARLQDTLSAIRKLSPDSRAFVVDVTKQDSVDAAVSAAIEQAGSI
ncbi:MAG: SDR family NAD(P)-dependent oxidoreductase, partial [Spirochaetes bacterium]|nr:SDR family NAD(P)-dependent oxidoreductase [Spirochaetota bacterium]